MVHANLTHQVLFVVTPFIAQIANSNTLKYVVYMVIKLIQYGIFVCYSWCAECTHFISMSLIILELIQHNY